MSSRERTTTLMVGLYLPDVLTDTELLSDVCVRPSVLVVASRSCLLVVVCAELVDIWNDVEEDVEDIEVDAVVGIVVVASRDDDVAAPEMQQQQMTSNVMKMTTDCPMTILYRLV